MDIELARTFLEIIKAGTFIKAADRLHVTQTTVTSRIKTLEEQLSCQLFVRNRAGAKLTPEGEKFVSYANTLVQTWNRAKTEMRLPVGHKSRLSLGGETSLWNPLMVNWLVWMRDTQPDVAVHSIVENATTLVAHVEKGLLDAAIVHVPNYHSGFIVEQLLEEKLIHVCNPGSFEPNLFVDWGDDFCNQYSRVIPLPRQTAFTFNFGLLALQTMLNCGGNGWFRTRVVEKYLESGELKPVRNSPEFTYPVYVTYRAGAHADPLAIALDGLREVTSSHFDWII